MQAEKTTIDKIRTGDLLVFIDWLAETHPEVCSLEGAKLCYLKKIPKRLLDVLEKWLPWEYRDPAPLRKYTRFRFGSNGYLKCFNRDAVRLLLKRVGVTAPSDYYGYADDFVATKTRNH